MRRSTDILFRPFGDKGNSIAIDRINDLAVCIGAQLTLLGEVPEPSCLHRPQHRAEFDASIDVRNPVDAVRSSSPCRSVPTGGPGGGRTAIGRFRCEIGTRVVVTEAATPLFSGGFHPEEPATRRKAQYAMSHVQCDSGPGILESVIAQIPTAEPDL